MGMKLTLDSLRAEIEENYGPVKIEGVPGGDVELVPIMRMKKEARQEFSNISATLNSKEGDDVDLNATVEKMNGLLRAVCASKTQADRLLKAIGDDGQLTQLIFEKYQEGTNLGKASDSPS